MPIKKLDDFKTKVITAENVIIGSGAGGSTTSYELLKIGKNSIILEEGPAIDFNEKMNVGIKIAKLYKNNGAIPLYSFNGGPLIGYGQGSCVGGSTFINAGYFSSTPNWVFDEWKKDQKVNFSYENFNSYLDEIRSEINISSEKLTENDLDSKILLNGCKKLNWKIEKCERFLKHCKRNNQCPIGCPSGSKQSMNVTYHKKLHENGINIVHNCYVDKIISSSDKAVFLIAKNKIDNKSYKIKLKNLFINCGPIGTPHLLIKNKLIKYQRNQHNFEFHINFKIIVKFKEKVNSNLSTVSIFFVREFEKEGVLLSAANSEIPYLLATLSHFDLGKKIDLYENFNNYALYVYQMKAKSRGQVKNFMGVPYVKYDFDDFDYYQIHKAIKRTSELFLSQGAEFILYPIENSEKVYSIKDADNLIQNFKMKKLHLISVHGMSSARSGIEANNLTDYFGKLKNYQNIFINDASILPGNTGESPQASIMAFAKHNVQNNKY